MERLFLEIPEYINETHPPYPVTGGAKMDPERLFAAYREYGSIIGGLHIPGEPGWQVIWPPYPYVPEGGGAHIMLANEHHGVKDAGGFDYPGMEHVVGLLLTATKERMLDFFGINVALEFNPGEDVQRNKWKKSPVSWGQPHWHGVRLNGNNDRVAQPATLEGLREFAVGISNKVLFEIFSSVGIENTGSIIEMGDIPIGGVKFKLKDDIAPSQLAVLMQSLLEKYKASHSIVANVFIDNYKDVVGSRGLIGPNFRSDESISGLIKSLDGSISEDRMKLLRLLHKGLQRSVQGGNPQWIEKILFTPASSTVCGRDNEGLWLGFSPHIVRTWGTVEMTLRRLQKKEEEGAAMNARKHEATLLYLYLNGLRTR